MKLKICPKCNKELPLSDFHINRERADNHAFSCKWCRKAYYDARKHTKFYKEKAQLPKSRFSVYKASAKTNSREFTLSLEEFETFWDCECFYCGRFFKGIGLDRVNSSRGYNLNNIVSCCTACNRMKSDLSLEKFLENVEKIFENLVYKTLDTNN